MLIGFDFDDTLHLGGEPNPVICELVRRNKKVFRDVCVITARNPEHENETWWRAYEPWRIVVDRWLADHDLPLEVVFCSHQPKAPVMAAIHCWRLYDNSPEETETARNAGLQGIPTSLGGVPLSLVDRGQCRCCGESLRLVGVYGNRCAACRCVV